ncbi:hypothetical protein AVEN_244848-1 [Araneus ventricosus]|uniref:RZZ complex subunit KNTC1/ROD C-terminal domain-containing protein n=1 Tax=Araneus ventricosus TaxID=182803 RepID=A0A4Y2KE50_ARAVE|nr:hypothetical protein AVEN_244848-1 [Araneus ventricosus]
MPSIQSTRLLFCFVSVFDVPTVAKALEWDPKVLADHFVPLQCSVELENLKLPYSLQTFTKCNKTELVQRILSTNFHNPKAVVFCIQLCIEYGIWDDAIWEVILRRMTVKDGKDYPLQGILQSVQGHLTHLWHSEAFKNAWKCVLSGILRSPGDSTTLASELYKAALSCPCISSMDDFFTMDELNCIIQTFEEKGLAEMVPITDVSSLVLNLMKVTRDQSHQDD